VLTSLHNRKSEHALIPRRRAIQVRDTSRYVMRSQMQRVRRRRWRSCATHH